jgi:hypothetical protein
VGAHEVGCAPDGEQSPMWRAAARTRTRTSLALGLGLGMSLRVRASRVAVGGSLVRFVGSGAVAPKVPVECRVNDD